MKMKMASLFALFLFALPVAGLAMSHGDHSGHGDHKMDHSKMDHSGHGDHDGMSAKGDMVMLGDMVEDGVKASAHMKDVTEAMKKMGMDTTHHFMVTFTSEETGAAIEKGIVAVKMSQKHEMPKDVKPIKLMGMQGHFGADITLDKKGVYHFIVATKLEDGKKRQFHFHFENK